MKTPYLLVVSWFAVIRLGHRFFFGCNTEGAILSFLNHVLPMTTQRFGMGYKIIPVYTTPYLVISKMQLVGYSPRSAVAGASRSHHAIRRNNIT